MKILRSLLSLLCMATLLGSSQQLEARLQPQPSQIRQINYSIWCEFPTIDFTTLSEEESTQTFTAMLDDLSKFCLRHNIRRVIFRILDPSEYDFFNPERFNINKNDNIAYWLHKFRSDHIDFEALFDGDTFHCNPSSLLGMTKELLDYYIFDFDNPHGKFFNLIEKLQWVSLVNGSHQGDLSRGPLIKGITINPKGEDEETRQAIINTVDKYKHNGDPDLPKNGWMEIRIAMVCHPDQKDFVLANTASYPLHQHLQSTGEQGDIGISLPKNFPTSSPHYLAPEWRYAQSARRDDSSQDSLLQTAYIFLDSPRLVEGMCRLPEDKSRDNDILQRAKCAVDVFRGKYFVKGPGRISIAKNSSTIHGKSTLFRTGRPDDRTGKLRKGNYIQLLLPNAKHPVLKMVIENPNNEYNAKIDTPIDGEEEIRDAEYYVSFGDDWSNSKISLPTANRIYLCLEAKPSCFGAWDLQDFMKFVSCRSRGGILNDPLFLTLNFARRIPMSNNLVIRDFTLIPNGSSFDNSYDWGLGNRARYRGIICAY